MCCTSFVRSLACAWFTHVPVVGPVVCAGDAVPGGFYMAADYVKHTHPMATSLSLLAWSLVEFKAGYEAAAQPWGHASLALFAHACMPLAPLLVSAD